MRCVVAEIEDEVANKRDTIVDAQHEQTGAQRRRG
jgi:hypothetical protein